MNILLLILSYNVEPYASLMRSQQETFDSVEVEGVTTIYYHGGQDKQTTKHLNDWSMECGFDITDEYFKMAGKFQRCLQQIHECGNKYDILFRSNSSSYINKQKLKDFAATLPTEKLYAGWTFTDSEDFNGQCVSGAGIFLSRDCVKILRDEIDQARPIEEDVYISRILRKNGMEAIDDKSRIDYPQESEKDLHYAYHIRFKGPSGNRLEDAANMRLVHKHIISE